MERAPAAKAVPTQDPRPIIFDIAFNNGDDTALYLAHGYAVVAVEANPALVEAGQNRFAAHIRSGRLKIVAKAIHRSAKGGRPLGLQFHISNVNNQWSSFDPLVACEWNWLCTCMRPPPPRATKPATMDQARARRARRSPL